MVSSIFVTAVVLLHAVGVETDTALFDRFRTEKGFPALRSWLGELRGTRKAGRACPYRVNSDGPCLTAAELDLPTQLVTLDEFLNPLPLAQDRTRQLDFSPGYPYLEGNAFWKLADYRWTTYYTCYRGHSFNDTFDPTTVANRSLVFWSLSEVGPDLSHFRRNIRLIPHSFFLITHHQDRVRFPQWLLDHPRVLKIFALNIPFSLQEHPKLIPLPLGIVGYTASPLKLPMQRRLQLAMAPSATLGEFLSNSSARGVHARPSKLLHVGSYEMRKGGTLLRLFRRRTIMRALGTRFPRAVAQKLPAEEYFSMLRQHRFVLSPPGEGWDCFRTWETLYLGRCPVVSRVLPDRLYEGLPVHVVDDWAGLTPTKLEAVWADFQTRMFDLARLRVDWWVTMIARECLQTP
eukprot:NODE_1692_length_1440_cov_24.061826_g1527_i0.p1 GENE.NODE_1692_length_1440_cov_24.061826_g1527_i0~~NODE_1692_length_1440_cov_24.061826_g1527_i0.p1  ORF type:complete len:404 (+),score=51.23 NODE_1692_length_1440_cov_24.061826_g1527_i0:47-1258(+)